MVYGNYQVTSDIGSDNPGQPQKSCTGTGVNFRPVETYCLSNDFTGLAKSELEKQTNYLYLLMALYVTTVQVSHKFNVTHVFLYIWLVCQMHYAMRGHAMTLVYDLMSAHV